MEMSYASHTHTFAQGPLPATPMPYFPMAHPPVAIPPQVVHQDTTDRARAYKSRNKRPCDFCRYKKAACHLDHAPPCELCVRYNKDCTFVESPAKRRRPNDGSTEGRPRQDSTFDSKFAIPQDPNGFVNGHVSAGGMDMQQELLNWEGNMAPFQIPGMGMAPSMDFAAFDPALYREPSLHFENFDPMQAPSSMGTGLENGASATLHQHRSSIDTTPSQHSALHPTDLVLPIDTTSGEPSLDNQASSNVQVVGMSGESDPYLLSRYRYDQYNEASFQQIRVRKMCDAQPSNGSLPTFFNIQHKALASKAQPPERSETLNQYRKEVEEMVSEDVGRRLIVLFYKYVQPYFPVLSRKHGQLVENKVCEPNSVPTCILAAIYGHALPFCAWDEKLCIEVYTPPNADALFRLAWLASLPELHTPSLAVLQTLLLLVQRRPTNKHVSDTPFKWVIMTTAVATAQALGINRDPGDWPLPNWEIKLRRRLAWATFIQDKWLALNFGRSSHIQPDDWDVQPLDEEDFEDADRALIEEGLPVCEHFLRLCELTEIVDDVLRDLFTIRATRALQNSLEATLEVAKPLRIRLTEWHQSLPEGLKPQSSPDSPGSGRTRTLHELNGNGSLHLAYITAKIELFRAMLRPRVTDGTTNAVQALRTGALAVAKEVFDFLEVLGARELEAFWASYSRANFTIASSFMLHLFVSSPHLADAKECLALFEAWRSLLRLKSRSCDLLNLALLRLDGVFVAGLESLIELSPAAEEAWAEKEGGAKAKVQGSGTVQGTVLGKRERE